MPSFGERLKEERTKKHITQQELAEKINVDRTTISKWEKDQSVPTIQDVQLIADELKVSLYNLIEDEGSEQKEKPEELVKNY